MRVRGNSHSLSTGILEVLPLSDDAVIGRPNLVKGGIHEFADASLSSTDRIHDVLQVERFSANESFSSSSRQPILPVQNHRVVGTRR